MDKQNYMLKEHELENSELASLLKYAECGICAYQIENGKKPKMMYMTDGFCEICDATQEEIFQSYENDRLFGVSDEAKESVNRIIAEAIITGEKREITYKALSLKGKKKWCTLKVNPDRRSDGFTMLYGTFFDVTKQMETQRNLSDLIQNIPGAVCLYHFNGTYLEPVVISERYSEMLGTDAYETLDKMRDLEFKHVHPDDLQQVKEKVYTALTKTHKLDYTYRSFNEKIKDYRWINVQGKVVIQEDGSSYAYVLYTDITRDKAIEQKLRASEQILEAATNHAGVWYWNCNWRENIAFLGERFQRDFVLPEKVTGFSKSMIQHNIIDKSYEEVFLNMCNKIKAGEKEAGAVVKGYLADGTMHWMEFKVTNVFDSEGVAQEAIGIMQLVDEYKEIERKYNIEKSHTIEDNDLLVHACFNLSTWETVEYAGSYLFENLKGTNLSVEDIGRAISEEIMDPDIRQQILKVHDRNFLLNGFAEGITEYSFEYQRKLTTGKYIWVQSIFHLVNDPGGTDIFLFEYCYDRNTEKTLNILTEYAVNDDYDLIGFVNVHDEKTIMVYGKNSYNPCHSNVKEDDYQTSMLAFANNAVAEEDRERYIHNANLSNVREQLEKDNNLEFYFNAKDENGNIRTKKVRYTKYQKEDNCYIYTQNDITQMVEEQKKNQEELKRALESAKVASNAKTSFLSQMSHEIRTPMNAIIGMTQLAEQTKNPAEIMHYLEQIDSSSQYLLGIINDILDMSRIESGKLELHPQWVDSGKIVKDCIEMLKPSMEKKQIKFVYPEKLNSLNYVFYVDPLRVQQIYMNLLNNAVKFTPEGGTITLSMKNIVRDETSARDRICIEDTGCGMSKEFLTRIFHPFEMEENPYSASVQGTGLGLALVKSFVTQMGGEIWVESELGKGSVFTMELPYKYKKKEKKDEIEEDIKITNLAEKRILLVDDHPLNREIAKKLLENEQAQVTVVVDGKDACDIFRQSEAYYFDAILMDIRMPVMDGLEATGEIRRMKREDAQSIPIIAMTANAFDEDMEKSLKAGMNAHLAKPIEPDKLYLTLAKFVTKQTDQ